MRGKVALSTPKRGSMASDATEFNDNPPLAVLGIQPTFQRSPLGVMSVYREW